MSESKSAGGPAITGRAPGGVIIDTDCGVDDAQALMLLLASDLDIKAITCVAGNCNVKQVTKNVCAVLTVCKRTDIPVFVGCERPLINEFVDATEWMGPDGLGGTKHPDAADMSPVDRSEHGVMALIRLLKASEPNSMDLLTLGPQTNLAMALRMDPGIVTHVRHYVMMGGCYLSKGNATLAAEYNVHADPESTAVCLDAFERISVVTWEATMDHPVPWETVESSWMSDKTAKSKFLRDISEFLTAQCKKVPEYASGLLIPDPLAAAVLLDPTVVTKSRNLSGEVELAGKHTRGAIVYDWAGLFSKKKPNLTVVMDIDMERVCRMLIESSD